MTHCQEMAPHLKRSTTYARGCRCPDCCSAAAAARRVSRPIKVRPPEPDLPGETWKAIPEYEGLYEASDMGRVRSLNRTVHDKLGRPTTRMGRILAPALQGPRASTYWCVGLSKHAQTRQAKIHHLVLETFTGPKPFADAVTRHLNGDRFDNRRVNLSWGTQQENIADKYRHGTDHNTNKTHCKWGHELSGSNIKMGGPNRKWRFCLACQDRRLRESVMRRSAAAAAKTQDRQAVQ